MPPKKKAGVSKTDIKPEPIPDEKQPADSSGYAFTGNIEVDFPEYLRALGVSHPPIVVMHKTNSGEEKTPEDIQDTVHELITHLPRVNVLYKEESEGKTTVQNIVQIHFRNFQIREIEAKAISQCLAKLDKLESVYFFRTRLSGDVFNLVTFPASVKSVHISANPSGENGDLWLTAVRKGIPHLGFQGNSLRSGDLIAFANELRKNNTLITLKLNNNPALGDDIFRYIFRSLVQNKKLVSISASNCGLTDELIEHITVPFAKMVEMVPSEIYEWRKKRMELVFSSDSQLRLVPNKRKDEKAKSTPPPRKTRGNKDAPDKKRKSQTWATSSSTDTSKPLAKAAPKIVTIPDDTGIKREDKVMRQPGNRSLCHLNLSNNKLTVFGILHLAEILEEQLERTTDAIALRQVNLALNQKSWKFFEDTEAFSATQKLIDTMRKLEKTKWAEVLQNHGLTIPPLSPPAAPVTPAPTPSKK